MRSTKRAVYPSLAMAVEVATARRRHRIAVTTARHPNTWRTIMGERELTYGEAVREAIAEEMRRDPPVFIGEARH